MQRMLEGLTAHRNRIPTFVLELKSEGSISEIRKKFRKREFQKVSFGKREEGEFRSSKGARRKTKKIVVHKRRVSEITESGGETSKNKKEF